MTNQDIYEQVKSIPLPESNYIVFHDNDEDCYYGKDNSGRIIFMAESKSPKLLPVLQETKSLIFAFNKKCTFSLEKTECTRIVHLLVCKESSVDSLLAFINFSPQYPHCLPRRKLPLNLNCKDYMQNFILFSTSDNIIATLPIVGSRKAA